MYCDCCQVDRARLYDARCNHHTHLEYGMWEAMLDPPRIMLDSVFYQRSGIPAVVTNLASKQTQKPMKRTTNHHFLQLTSCAVPTHFRKKFTLKQAGFSLSLGIFNKNLNGPCRGCYNQFLCGCNALNSCPRKERNRYNFVSSSMAMCRKIRIVMIDENRMSASVLISHVHNLNFSNIYLILQLFDNYFKV